MKYTGRVLRRRGDTDEWEVVLSTRIRFPGGPVRSIHTVEGKTERAAKKARDELIMELEF